MPEVQEVFHMATQKVRPDPGALERQHRDQRRHVARQKAAVFALIGALVVGGAALGISALRSKDDPRSVGSDPTASPLPTVEPGSLAPGPHVMTTLDRKFDASHRITIEVPEGYSGFEGGWAVAKDGLDPRWDTAVSLWVIRSVFSDACEWRGTASRISSADDVVAALAGQEPLRPSAPAAVTVAGFAGTHIEVTTPSSTNLDRCDMSRVNVWRGRWLNNPGQLDELWLLDVDGAVFAIDVSVGRDASAKDRAELQQMVDSIRIEPR